MKNKVLEILIRRMSKAKYYIDKIGLIKHPEGGFYKEVYRSGEDINTDSLDDRFPSKRNISSSIYFLLERDDFSAFHKIKSDEIWHFYDGDMIEIYSISPEGELTLHKLGLDLANNESPQLCIPHGHFFAAKTSGDYTLVGCTVAPAFDFSDFEMPDKKTLSNLFPEHSEIIDELGK